MVLGLRILGSPVLAMHAPDGLFSPSVNALFAVVVAIVLGLALRHLTRRNDHRLAPTMGVMAAFVFAAQMVNFPVAAGTSGHLLGGTLAAILLGPWAGTVVMAAVIVFQALLGDGGVTALGPNIFNMGVVGSLLAYFVYRAVVGVREVRDGRIAPAGVGSMQNGPQREGGCSRSGPAFAGGVRTEGSPARVVAASSFAAWLAVVMASVLVSVQLAVSDRGSLGRVLPAMLLTHAVIGVGEALITAGVVAFVLKTRPDLLYDRQPAAASPVGRAAIVVGLGGSLVVALFLSLLPMLWDFPDGLEYVGIEKGFVFEEGEKAADGSPVTIPAYPLGVRLAMRDGAVTVVHRYEALDRRGASESGEALLPGDQIAAVGGRPIADLSSVVAAMGYDATAKTFGLRPNELVAVRVVRGGRAQDLTIQAMAAPVAGATLPLVALLPDYTIPGLGGLLGTSLAGGLGTAVMFVVSLGIGRAFTRRGRLEAALERARQAEAAGGSR